MSKILAKLWLTCIVFTMLFGLYKIEPFSIVILGGLLLFGVTVLITLYSLFILTR